MMIIIIELWDLKTETVPAGSDRNTWPSGKVLARRVSSCPMDTHFRKKYKENSPNLFLILWENMPSGWLVFNVWLKACLQGLIGPLQLVIHVVQNLYAGEQETSSWDKRNKGNCHVRWYKLFICLLPVSHLLSSMVDFAKGLFKREWKK